MYLVLLSRRKAEAFAPQFDAIIDSSCRCKHLNALQPTLFRSPHSPQAFPVFRLADKPICRPDQKKIYGVARNEAAEIVCEVDAFPPPENFKWSFNNTAETFDMPQSGFRPHSAQGSTLTYTPVKVRLIVSPEPAIRNPECGWEPTDRELGTGKRGSHSSR